MERERLEKLKKKIEKEQAEKEAADKVFYHLKMFVGV